MSSVAAAQARQRQQSSSSRPNPRNKTAQHDSFRQRKDHTGSRHHIKSYVQQAYGQSSIYCVEALSCDHSVYKLSWELPVGLSMSDSDWRDLVLAAAQSEL